MALWCPPFWLFGCRSGVGWVAGEREVVAVVAADGLSQFWASAWEVMWVVPVKGMGVRALYFAEHSSGVSPQ